MIYMILTLLNVFSFAAFYVGKKQKEPESCDDLFLWIYFLLFPEQIGRITWHFLCQDFLLDFMDSICVWQWHVCMYVLITQSHFWLIWL